MSELFKPKVEMRKIAEKGSDQERQLIDAIKRDFDQKIIAKSKEIGTWETLRRQRSLPR